MKYSISLVVLVLVAIGCSKSQARRPINPKPSTTIYQESIAASKKMYQLEENRILEFIKQDSTQVYKTSPNGFWYTYNTKIEQVASMVRPGDVVALSYDIRDLNDSIIYSKEDLGVKTYTVDKEDFISGIQKGIKLMKLGETITFVIPSYNAFGISGDGNRIGMNTTIKSTVTLLNIK